jgi:hypothetical protein
MYVMLLGDTHASLNHWQIAIGQCIRWQNQGQDLNKIFQLGDFGYWSDDYIKKLNRMAGRANVTAYWLDGNHENFNKLDQFLETAEFDNEGFAIMADNVRYSPRGHRWEWDGVSFMSIGGAFSIDYDSRIEGVDWFPQEMIKESDIEKAGTEHVDVLLSHDAPGHVDLNMHWMINNHPTWHWKQDTQSILNKNRLHQIVMNTTPYWHIHGHLHMRYMDDFFEVDGHRVRVDGLDCNYNPTKSWIVIDTERIGRVVG